MDRHIFVYFAAGKNKRAVVSALIAPTFITILGRGICHSVCAREISAGLPACCLSCNAGQMVCMPFSRQHNWDLGERTTTRTDRPTGQFLFLAFSFALSVSPAVASLRQIIAFFAAADDISTGNDVRLSRLRLFLSLHMSKQNLFNRRRRV